jgi:hypothetical protein
MVSQPRRPQLGWKYWYDYEWKIYRNVEGSNPSLFESIILGRA